MPAVTMAMRSTPPIGAFSDRVLANDLPDLDVDQRAEVVAFVQRRVAGMPSPMRVGVGLVAAIVGVSGRLIGADRAVRLVGARPLPLLGEYVRLVRSLGYAYVWETWPDTTATGGRP